MSAVLAFPGVRVDVQGIISRTELEHHRESRFYDRDEAVDSVKDGLELNMRNAMSGTVQFVPSYVRKHPGASPREVSQHVTEAIIESLDHMETAAAFWDVLKSSTCPMVQALRDHLAKGYAQLNGDEIAEARGI